MPEWYLAILILGLLSAAGAFWSPLLLALPLLGGAVAALLVDAGLGAARARFSNQHREVRLRILTGLLYLLQPLARLYGRITHGLTPWRRRGQLAFGLPIRRTSLFWSEQWQGTEDRVRAIAQTLRADGSVIRSGGDWDRWDLQVRGGLLGVARLRIAIEEHGAGRQLVRVRSWPHTSGPVLVLGALAGAIAAIALVSNADAVTIGLGAFAAGLLLRLVYECGAATTAIQRALRRALEASVSEPVGAEAVRPVMLGTDALPLGQPVGQ
jgi:hypothetical protein